MTPEQERRYVLWHIECFGCPPPSAGKAVAEALEEDRYNDRKATRRRDGKAWAKGKQAKPSKPAFSGKVPVDFRNPQSSKLNSRWTNTAIVPKGNPRPDLKVQTVEEWLEEGHEITVCPPPWEIEGVEL